MFIFIRKRTILFNLNEEFVITFPLDAVASANDDFDANDPACEANGYNLILLCYHRRKGHLN